MSGYSVAELVLFLILVVPSLYVLWKHGRPGIKAWTFLVIFCGLRIAAGALALAHKSAANVIGNIGMSTLLLTTHGIVLESWLYSDIAPLSKLEKMVLLGFHTIVGLAVGFLITGATGLSKPDPTPSDIHKLKVGITLMLVGWGYMMTWAASVLLRAWRGKSERMGRSLQMGVLVALCFVGVRIFYTFIAILSENADLNPTTGKLAVRIILELLMESCATITLIITGILTRDAQQDPLALKRHPVQDKEEYFQRPLQPMQGDTYVQQPPRNHTYRA